MNKIHEFFSQRSEAYSRWHQNPAHSLAHWGVFLAAAILITSSLVSQVNADSLAAASQSDSSEKSGPQVERSRKPVPAQDRILVKFKDNAGQAKKAEVLAKHGLKEKSEIKQIGVKIIEVDTEKDTYEEVIDRLKGEKDIEFAEPDNLNFPALTPNDPSYPSQWERTITNAPTAWDTTTGASSTIIVAITDTGVDCTHPDLNCVSGWNTYDNNNNSADVYGHGTAVAGTAAAIGNNGAGVAGQAWVKTMPIRVSLPDGSAYDSDIAEGIVWAADHGARVANASYYFGSATYSVQSAAQYLRGKGGLLTVSAGNYGTDTGGSANNNIIIVSASDPSDLMYSFSSFGNDVDVAAPGCVTTTANGGGYRGACGTSFSAPMTAGTLALIFAAKPTLTPDQAQSVLFSTAKDLGTPGWDKYYGWGRIDAAAAIASLGTITVDTQPPTVPTNLSANPVSSSQINLAWSASTDTSGVTGYDVYRNGSKVATVSGTSYNNTGLTASTAYTYTVAAFDASGNVSAQSTPVTATTPAAPAPTVSITSFQVTNKTTNSATITWSTNIPSTGSVSYGTSRSSLTLSATDGVVATTHTVNLTNLSKGATYYYKIISTSQDGTSNAQSAVSSFKTARK